MKIFKKEGEVIKSVFVQRNDLGFLNDIDTPIPASIYMKSFNRGSNIINNRNRFDYIEFTEQNEIEYFKNTDFILDYEEYANLSLEELEIKCDEVGKQIGEIAEKYNAFSASEKIKNKKMYDRFEQLKFMIYGIADLYEKTQSNEEIKLPEGINISIMSKQPEEKELGKKLENKFKNK